MLKSSFKISHTTTTEFFELIFFPSHQKLWQKYCCEDLSDSSDLLTYWLSISVLTHGFLGIYVTPLFPVYILETNKIWGSSFFPKYPKFYVAFGNAKKKIQKIFFNFLIIAFELVALNTSFYWERILFIWWQYVKKHFEEFRYY